MCITPGEACGTGGKQNKVNSTPEELTKSKNSQIIDCVGKLLQSSDSNFIYTPGFASFTGGYSK